MPRCGCSLILESSLISFTKKPSRRSLVFLGISRDTLRNVQALAIPVQSTTNLRSRQGVQERLLIPGHVKSDSVRSGHGMLEVLWSSCHHNVNARLLGQTLQRDRDRTVSLAGFSQELFETVAKFESDTVASNVVIDLEAKF